MTADLLNRQIGGWRQYTHSATTAAWLSHHFYLHWRYSRDRHFLAERAYPYLEAAALFLEHVTAERDARGFRMLPLSSSPEIHDNRPEAWFPTITNYDNALIRWLFSASAELAEELGVLDRASHYRALLSEMPPLAVGDDGGLLVAEDAPLQGSHRHFSHLMAMHPLGSVDAWQTPEQEACARASLEHVERLGSAGYCGYSFSWLACFRARVGDGAKAVQSLRILREAFCSRSGLHLNGDFKDLGYADFKGRAFTLEGNFAAAEAVHQLLLQSHGGVIRIFPALPPELGDASFTLLAEGAFLISARRQAGVVSAVEVIAQAGGTCRLVSPWTSHELRFQMQPGERKLLTEDVHS